MIIIIDDDNDDNLYMNPIILRRVIKMSLPQRSLTLSYQKKHDARS